MIRVGTSYSTSRNSEKAAAEAVEAALAKAGITKSDATIVFATSHHREQYPEMLKKISETAQSTVIAGSSAYGILTEEIEIEQDPGIAVMVLASDEIDTSSFLIPNLQENNFKAGEALASSLKGSDASAKHVFLFPDPFSFQSHSFFDGFESGSGYLPLYGGLASEDGREGKTYQFAGTESAFDSISGLVLEGNLVMEAGITRSCQPFGEPLKITRADGNIIYEIDGHPAYDILLESISNLPIDNTDQIFQRVFLGVPMKNFQTDFMESPFLIRNILSVNAKKGVLACASPIEEGEYVTFTVRDSSFARQDLRATLENLSFQFAPHQPAFGFYFNCCSRGQALYGRHDEDISLIHQYFPKVPIIGFFSYGEIAPVDHVNHLHHHAGVLNFFTDL